MDNNNEAQPAVTTDEALPEHPCPKCNRRFSSPFGLRMHNVRKHSGRNWDTSSNFRKKFNWRTAREKRMANLNRRGGKPWRAGQLEKFQATMRKKAKAKKIQIVYPNPADEQRKIDQAIANTWPDKELAQVRIPALKHCPNCGEHIEGWRYQP